MEALYCRLTFERKEQQGKKAIFVCSFFLGSLFSYLRKWKKRHGVVFLLFQSSPPKRLYSGEQEYGLHDFWQSDRRAKKQKKESLKAKEGGNGTEEEAKRSRKWTLISLASSFRHDLLSQPSTFPFVCFMLLNLLTILVSPLL